MSSRFASQALILLLGYFDARLLRWLVWFSPQQQLHSLVTHCHVKSGWIAPSSLLCSVFIPWIPPPPTTLTVLKKMRGAQFHWQLPHPPSWSLCETVLFIKLKNDLWILLKWRLQGPTTPGSSNSIGMMVTFMWLLSLHYHGSQFFIINLHFICPSLENPSWYSRSKMKSTNQHL
jgi:hypothetical protein